MKDRCLLAIVALLVSSSAYGQDRKGIEFFENRIRPVLINQCYECHSAKSTKIKGGLVLDTRDGLLKGGDTGPAVIPGKVAESLLIKSLYHKGDLKMPPKGKLSPEVVADFEAWVRMGAPDPRTSSTAVAKTWEVANPREWWSFQTPKKTAIPKVKDAAWPLSDIDRFVLAKIEANGLKPVSAADKGTLLRRLTFDLTGLPPRVEDLEAFLKDTSPQAIEKAVDRLLATDQFGERWGRHWLDIARYAESNGNVDNILFPYAYRYRDYVIAAFQRDKPLNQFIKEQIAGDLLPAATPEARDQQLIATGFLALTSKPRAQNNPDYEMDLVADQIDVTSRAVLGLSVLCARCHDHKFDPIPTKEYYSLAGIFQSTIMLGGAGGKGAKKNGGGGLVSLSNGYCMGVKEGAPSDTEVRIRGESQKKGERVQRGFLTAATPEKAPAINRSQSGRLELAEWLTQPENPLTARVYVNRVWHHLFGRGIVPSVDNFGALGEAPSHAELLDYLAVRFVTPAEKGGFGWSTKKIIKAIVLTRAYQLSSQHDAANYAKDPDDIWLWRMRPRRLDAESIRDAILALSGKLVLNPPGRSLVSGQAVGKKQVLTANDTNHRSVYMPIIRNGLPEALSVFDGADPSLIVGDREVTTVPAQALFLMNNPFVVEQARAFADKLVAAKDLNDAGRVDLAYKMAFARSASAEERDRATDFLRECRKTIQAKNAEDQAWTGFCQALIASAEFRYLQ